MTTIDDGTAVRLGSASLPLADAYDVGLLDLDGVIYLDGELISSAADAITKARGRGMRFAFVTNNASRTPRRIAHRLEQLGITATAGDVVTSAQAAARLVADRVPAGSAVLTVGALGLRYALREHGLQPVTTAHDRPAAVVQGYHPQMSYSLLAEGALAVRQGAVYVASNADTTMPTPRGPLPGNGALVQVISTATGTQPLVAGKPELPLHREAVLRMSARCPLVVGDRLDTDIEGAVRAGTPSLLVLTGVTESRQVVMAPPQLRPTFIARDLGGLLEAHPETHPEIHRENHPETHGQTHVEGEAWWCRGWWARNRAGRLSLERDSGRANDPIDGLRALCAAAWNGNDPIDAAALTEALAAIPDL